MNKKLIIGIAVALVAVFAVIIIASSSDNAKNPSSSCTHTYVSNIVKDATCKEMGSKTNTCTICGFSYTENIAKTDNHTYTSQITKEPTESELGEITYTCNICGYSYKDSLSKLQVESIMLSKSNIVIGVGERTLLLAIVVPSNINPNLIWKSSDQSIVEVDQKGNINAKKAGEAYITVESLNGKIAMCNIEVVEKTGGIKGSAIYSGKPCVSAWVYIYSATRMNIESGDKPDFYAETDVDGKFEISNIPVGEYYVQIKTFDKKEYGSVSKWYGDFFSHYSASAQESKKNSFDIKVCAIRTELVVVKYNEYAKCDINFNF